MSHEKIYTILAHSDNLPKEKGSYLLIMRLERSMYLNVGALGSLKFEAGWYIYVGSAMNGLSSRLKRYLNPPRKLRWHIDYLMEHVKLIQIVCFISSEPLEETLAKMLEKHFDYIRGFGATDAKSASHLFVSPINPIDKIQYITENLSIRQFTRIICLQISNEITY